MSVESRPVVYLPTMTDEEVIAYAQTHAATSLEYALLTRLIAAKNLSERDTFGKYQGY